MKAATHRKRRGYTIAEVLIAAGLLGVMIGSAVTLIGTMNAAETTSRSTAVATNILDCAAQLWQLGLSPAEVSAVLPVTTNNEILSRCVVADGSGNTVTFGTAGTTTLANSMGTVENITVSVVSLDPTPGPAAGANNRTLTATVFRPTSR